ncbi:right-handed parallel beta-helix repeat-containing protein, partial [Candidatus Sumerlaeota bacterium]|nr:right-handed parallel beta-helix repeat-containing protein [Candidatus Sumerlaeota bacterium]
ETKTELLPFGFILNDGGAPNTQVTFEDCVARNNMKPNQTKKYKNGDGFVVEGNSREVLFRRCLALRNQDGGFDLKVPDVRLTDCVAVGNKRGFRVWTTGALTNCLAAGGETGLWCNGGPLTAVRCTFHAAQGFAVTGDDRATEPITVLDSIISAAPDATVFHPTGRKVILSGTIVSGPKQAGKAPAYPRPDPNWDGRGEAMDSAAYPDKGYRSTAVRIAR